MDTSHCLVWYVLLLEISQVFLALDKCPFGSYDMSFHSPELHRKVHKLVYAHPQGPPCVLVLGVKKDSHRLTLDESSHVPCPSIIVLFHCLSPCLLTFSDILYHFGL